MRRQLFTVFFGFDEKARASNQSEIFGQLLYEGKMRRDFPALMMVSRGPWAELE